MIKAIIITAILLLASCSEPDPFAEMMGERADNQWNAPEPVPFRDRDWVPIDE